MAETVLEELQRYVNWNEGDEAALRALLPLARPHFERIATVFYDRILDHEEARKALVGGESSVGRLKVTLVAWMERLLAGPWDDDYFELRCRIGRVHVRIALPQHYMFAAMNVLRRELNAVIDARYATRLEELAAARAALGKGLDIELAIMLHTYREDLLAQQSRVERLSTFGQLVGSIGHELRNPLGVMETSLFILKSRMKDDERAAKHVGRIGEQLVIANSIITDLLDMIRDKPLSRERLALAQIVETAAAAVKRPEQVRLQLDGLMDVPEVDGDASQLRQVFVNLIDNAVHAAGPQGEVRVQATATEAHVEVTVEDSGKGIDPAIRARLFEPLITTKAKGIGLGLALVKRIVERHGGTIAHAPLDKGARFVIRLPRAA
ncbi:MAG TPA: HAMP domain-containing sensor histidine kinase [Myxococcales bacterium]|nr:HAMP domain-containing sensor histidine kinase [Myxococcales bacterium]